MAVSFLSYDMEWPALLRTRAAPRAARAATCALHTCGLRAPLSQPSRAPPTVRTACCPARPYALPAAARITALTRVHTRPLRVAAAAAHSAAAMLLMCTSARAAAATVLLRCFCWPTHAHPQLQLPLALLLLNALLLQPAPRRPAEPHCRAPTEPHCRAATAAASAAATAPTAATATMATFSILSFDAEGHAITFDIWLDDLQLFLQSEARDGIPLFAHTNGSLPTPLDTETADNSKDQFLPLDPTELTLDSLKRSPFSRLRRALSLSLPLPALPAPPSLKGVHPPLSSPQLLLLLLSTSLALRLLLVGGETTARAKGARVVGAAAVEVAGVVVAGVEAVVVAGVEAVVVALGVEAVETDGVVIVLRLHSDRGGEFSSGLLEEFCRDKGICRTFTLPASPQQNGIAEPRIGLIMEVARTSMIHAAAPHFQWVLRSDMLRISSTSGPLFYHPRERQVFPSQDVTFDEFVCFYRLHPHASHPVPLAPPFLVPVIYPVDPLPPQGPDPLGVSQVDPPTLVEPLEISSDSSGPAKGGDPAADDTAATRRSPRLETPPGFPPRSSSPPPQPAAVEYGAETAGAEPRGAEIEGEGSWGAGSGGAGSGGAATRGADSGGAASPSGGGAVGDPAGGRGARQPPQLDLLETLLPQAIRAWIVRRGSPGGGGYGPTGVGAANPRGTAGAGGAGGTTGGAGAAASAGGASGAGAAGAARAGGAASAGGAGGAKGAGGTAGGDGAAAGAGGTSGAGGAGAARARGAGGAGAARARGAGGARGTAGGAGAAAGAGGTGAASTGGAAGAGGASGAGGAGAARAGGAGGVGGAGGTAEGTGAASTGGAASARGASGAGGAGAARAAGAGGVAGGGGAGASTTGGARPAGALCHLLGLPPTPTEFPVAGTTLPLLFPQLLPHSPLPAPAPYTAVTESLAERREPETRASTPERQENETRASVSARFCRGRRPHSPAVPGTHDMTPRPSSVPQRVVLPSPPASSLPDVADPPSDLARASSPLRRPVYGLRQALCEWHDTLRTTLAALGFAPITVDPSLFLRTDTTMPPFYVIVYVDALVFATTDTEALALVKAELQKRHTCTDVGELRIYLGLQITRERPRRTITLTQSHMVHKVLQHFRFQYSSPQPTPLSTGHSLSAPPSAESVELSGLYPELVGCLMYLMTCTGPDLAYPLSLLACYMVSGRHRKGSVVLTGHSDASWADDQATQRSSQGYTFSLGSGSVSWRSTRSSSVLSSSCEAENYAGAMAAQELRWLTYLLTDLGERPRSPPVLYHFCTALGLVPTLPHLQVA
ncbi:unnamed protein product [Closterium sp. NIES-53]